MRRLLFMAAGVLLAVAAPCAAGEAAGQRLLVPRVLEGRVAALAIDRVDVDLVLGLTAARDVTLRRLAFLETRIGNTPVAVEETNGRWSLEAGVEQVLDRPVRVRVYAKDLVGIASLAELLARDVVQVQTTVEVSFATPWLARLLLLGPSQVAISDVTLDVPLTGSGDPVSQLLRAGAAAVGMISAYALPGLTRMQSPSPLRKDVESRLAASTAAVVTSYAIAQGTSVPVARTMRSLGFWWTAATFCTTREALEPWRFDAGDAAALEHGQGRLDRRAVTIRVVTRGGGERRLDARALLEQLPRAGTQARYAQVGNGLRRIALLDRTAASNVVCLTGVDGVSAGAAVEGRPAMAVAAAVDGQRDGLAWTDIRDRQGDGWALTAPVAASSFGSPLLSADGVVGMVVSARHALSAAQVGRAAARPVRVRFGTA